MLYYVEPYSVFSCQTLLCHLYISAHLSTSVQMKGEVMPDG